MKTVIVNFFPDVDCVAVEIGPNGEVVISTSRDEHGEVAIQVTNNSTGEDTTIILGAEGGV